MLVALVLFVCAISTGIQYGWLLGCIFSKTETWHGWIAKYMTGWLCIDVVSYMLLAKICIDGITFVESCTHALATFWFALPAWALYAHRGHIPAFTRTPVAATCFWMGLVAVMINTGTRMNMYSSDMIEMRVNAVSDLVYRAADEVRCVFDRHDFVNKQPYKAMAK